MRLSAEETSSIAEERGFLPGPVERVIRLFDVLEGFVGDEVMGPRMALVGGTVLNAFQATVAHERMQFATPAFSQVRSTGNSEGRVN